MKLAEGETELATYARKRSRTAATLTLRRLIIRRDGSEEHHAFSKLSAVTSRFRRRPGEAASGLVILLLLAGFAALLVWLESNLPALVDFLIRLAGDGGEPNAGLQAAREQLMARATSLIAFFPVVRGLLGLCALYGLWLVVAGIRGETRLAIVSAGGRLEFHVAGRDRALLEFGEQVAQRLK